MENAARGLERETQTYKDERANDLRSQIERERGSYATKDDIAALVSQFDAKLNALSSNAWTRTLAVASIVATVAIGVFLTVHVH